jgi:hypothetical protein
MFWKYKAPLLTTRFTIYAIPALLLMSAGSVRAAEVNENPTYVPAASGQLLTQWTGSENLCHFGALTFQLYAGGRAVMFDATSMSDGVWQQNGQQITLWFGAGRVVYTGVVHGNGMSGTAQTGRAFWSWSVASVELDGTVDRPTSWVGGENLIGYGALTFQLYADGKAAMLDARAISYGAWQQNGQQITLSFDDGRVVYTGVVNGNVMSGSAQKGCSTWTWNLAR